MSHHFTQCERPTTSLYEGNRTARYIQGLFAALINAEHRNSQNHGRPDTFEGRKIERIKRALLVAGVSTALIYSGSTAL